MRKEILITLFIFGNITLLQADYYYDRPVDEAQYVRTFYDAPGYNIDRVYSRNGNYYYENGRWYYNSYAPYPYPDYERQIHERRMMHQIGENPFMPDYYSQSVVFTRDQQLKEAIQDYLLANWESKNYERTQVAVRHGEVTLRGNVDTQDDLNYIEITVLNMVGIRKLDNQLEVRKTSVVDYKCQFS